MKGRIIVNTYSISQTRTKSRDKVYTLKRITIYVNDSDLESIRKSKKIVIMPFDDYCQLVELLKKCREACRELLRTCSEKCSSDVVTLLVKLFNYVSEIYDYFVK